MTKLRSIFFIPLLMIASSCASNHQQVVPVEELEPDPAEIYELRNDNCLPYGQCMPGECGEKPAGCGITMSCGPCPEACPGYQFRSCACMPRDPPDRKPCPCMPMSQHQECIDNPQPGQANARYVCAMMGTILTRGIKPSEYRVEPQGSGKITLDVTLDGILQLHAEFPETALASPWMNCLGPNEVTGYADYPKSPTQNAGRYKIFAMHFRHMDLTGVEQGKFAMTVQVFLRKQDDPTDARTLVFKYINPTISLAPPAPPEPRDPQGNP